MGTVVLCVFAKPPVPGRCKSRLAAGIGEIAAARLAAAFLTDTLSALRDVPGTKTVVATTEVEPMLRAAVPDGDVEFWLQGDGDLGARMARMACKALSNADAVILLGADSPGLPTALMRRAVGLLRSGQVGVDAVMSRCEDGGFCLLGLRRATLTLLDDLPWSAADTADATLARLWARGLDCTLVDPWWDVDDVKDLKRLHRALESGCIVAPATASVLRALVGRGELA